jgi:acylphosphatase
MEQPSPPPVVRRAALIITGRVQGVLYRAEARREARKLGLTGFVRNREDGTVHAEAEGADTAVGAFIRWCRRGPENARVEDVKVEEREPEGGEGFVVRD